MPWLLVLQFSSVLSASFLLELDHHRQAMARLYEDLGSHAVFQSRFTALPPGAVVHVDIGYFLLQIAAVSEAKQTIETNFFVQVSLRDPCLAWDVGQYGNITQVRLPGNIVWLPYLYIMSSTDDSPQRLADPDYVILDHTGAINYRLTSFTTTFCSFDLTYYPLDSQTCEIPIIVYGCDVSVSTNATRMEKSPLSREALDRVHGEWTLTGVTLSGNFSVADVSYFKVIVRIKRSQLYYILCVLLPMVMTSLLTLMVFWIPPGSGEKISYLVTIYMSSTLYLSIVGDTFPRNINQGGHLHRMTLFLVFIIMEGVIAIIATVFVMRRHHDEVARDTAHLMCLASPRRRVEKSEDIPESGRTDNDQPLAKNKTIAGGQNGIFSSVLRSIVDRTPLSLQHSATVKQIDGKKLSAALLDRMFFFIFLAVCAPFYALVFII